MLDQITGDVIWSVIQGEMKKGNKPRPSIATWRRFGACYAWRVTSGNGSTAFLGGWKSRQMVDRYAKYSH